MRQGAYDGNTLTMDELAYEYDGNQLLGEVTAVMLI